MGAHLEDTRRQPPVAVSGVVGLEHARLPNRAKADDVGEAADGLEHGAATWAQVA